MNSFRSVTRLIAINGNNAGLPIQGGIFLNLQNKWAVTAFFLLSSFLWWIILSLHRTDGWSSARILSLLTFRSLILRSSVSLGGLTYARFDQLILAYNSILGFSALMPPERCIRCCVWGECHASSSWLAFDGRKLESFRALLILRLIFQLTDLLSLVFLNLSFAPSSIFGWCFTVVQRISSTELIISSS